MIKIPDSDCFGCGACEQICPKNCINLINNGEGFLNPKTDSSCCINCHLCEHVCPAQTSQIESQNTSYIATNRNSAIKLLSSSGGIFGQIAGEFITAGGIVFGAAFDENWNIAHKYIDDIANLHQFMGSKYVQSRIGDSFKHAKRLLDKGLNVLFSGTPCQIAGLKCFLRKDYDNLLCIDFICHGIPAPTLWQKYLHEELHRQLEFRNIPSDNKININHISFRDKRNGWKNFGLSINYSVINQNYEYFSEVNQNPFLKGFVLNLYLRKVCYKCPFKDANYRSDITLGDAWGVWNYKPGIDDDKGTSYVITHTPKGVRWFMQDNNFDIANIDYDLIKKYNITVIRPPKLNRKRRKFFKLINKGYSFEQSVHKCLPKDTIFTRIIWSINKRLRKYAK